MNCERARFYSEFAESESMWPTLVPGSSTLGRLASYTRPLRERSSEPVRRISLFLLVLSATATLAPLRAQQELKRRPGNFLIYGPVHTIRDERVTFTKESGNLVEGPRVPVQTITYNEDGTKQEWTSYSPAGNIVYRRVEAYDPEGRILETSN